MNRKSPIWNFPFTETRPPLRLSGNRIAEGKEPEPGSDVAAVCIWDVLNRLMLALGLHLMAPCERLWSLQEVEQDGENSWEDLGSLNQPWVQRCEPLGSAHRQVPPEMPRTTLIRCAFLTINEGSDSEHQVNSFFTKWFLTDTLSHQTKPIQRCTELGSQLTGREEAVWVGRISLKL